MIEKLFPHPAGALAQVVTAEECIAHTRAELASEGAVLLGFAAAAQSLVEQDISTPLAPRELVARADSWPCLGREGGWLIWCKKPISIDGISYTDVDGDEQILPPESYLLREYLGVTHVVFRQTATLPEIDADTDILITLTAGWPPGECPAHLRQVVLALTDRFYMKRLAELDEDTQRFLDAMLGRDRLHSIA